MNLCDNTDSKAAPLTGQQLRVHTQPFAFRAPEEDDESVKISTMTPSRSSALRASDHAPSIVILRPALLFHAGRRISPAFFGTLDPPKPQFLFDTNKPFAFTTNFSARRKQSTSFFLFDTNEPSQITNHQSLITKARRIP